MSLAAPHALLVAYWGSDGAAALSIPTKEYFQSSGWVEQRPPPPPAASPRHDNNLQRRGREGPNQSVDIQSVRSGSDFWAGTRSRTPSSSAFTASNYLSDATASSHSPFSPPKSRSQTRHNQAKSPGRYNAEEDDDNDSQGTETPGAEEDVDDGVVDEVGAQDAFVAGMIYALSRRIVPGPPYTPFGGGVDDVNQAEVDRGRWRLDECLRFATELAGRKARRRTWSGLAEEISRAGWFEG
ncbi:hypothetical protein ONZ45_g18229 [Pleurotus djamor]|nr:hypothetical protein ONZ45_g18229 [Pleurotus djamor]